MRKNQFNVYFCKNSKAFLEAIRQHKIPKFSIVIYPFNKSPANLWFELNVIKDDLGFHRIFLCKVAFLDEVIRAPLYESVKSTPREKIPLDSKTIIRKIAKELNTTLIKSSDLPPFVTSMGEISNYRDIVDKLKSKGAIEVLKSVNDLATLQRFRSEKWHRNLFDYYDINSFFSTKEEIYSFQMAGDIIGGGLKAERLNSKLTEFQIQFNLADFRNDHIINFNFHENTDAPKCPINVLIGKNGIGKSATLKKIVNFFSGERENRDLLINRLLVVDNSISNSTFPKEISKSDELDYRKIALLSAYTPKDNIVSDLISIALSQEKIGQNIRSQIFFNAIQNICPVNEIVIPLQADGATAKEYNYFSLLDIPIDKDIWFPIFKQGGQKLQPMRLIGGKLFPFSSGQLNFIRLAAWLCFNIENGSLVLMDEPDVYLHPSYITHFVNLLYNILNSTGARAIIATHSAYIIREVPKEKVFVYSANTENEIIVGTPAMATVGADVGEISFFIFEEAFYGSFIESIKAELNSLKKEDRSVRLLELSKSLSIPAHMYLRRTINTDL